MKRLAQIFSVLAILIAVVWFIFEPGFEPIITALFGIAGLVASLKIKKGEKIPEYLEKFRYTIKGIQARWEAEKSIKPSSLDEAKFGIITPLIDALVELSASTQDESIITSAGALIRRAKSLQYHQTYIDGGKSYNEFWNKGDQLLIDISALIGVGPR